MNETTDVTWAAALPAGSWLASPAHRSWLTAQSATLLRFFRNMLQPSGWFCELDDDGRPLPTGCPAALQPQQNLLTVSRAVHSFALGELLGVPGCGAIVEAGLEALWERHRDLANGGYFSAVGHKGPTDTTKAAYDHAFVLLAASSALASGHDASAVFDDVLAIVDEHFWSEEEGASREAFDRDWDEVEAYRGANSNMHLTESFLAAAAATGRSDLAERAARTASKLIDGFARSNGWLLPEHYDSQWRPQFGYNRDRLDHPFRPYGAQVGHSVEWSRLVLTAGMATGHLEDGWFLEAAQALFSRAVEVGWDPAHRGLAYTVDWDGEPVNRDHYWWPVAEGICTTSYLVRFTGKPFYEQWYRRFWDYASDVLIDHARGGWYPLFDPENHKKNFPWFGKPDIYHALQACLVPSLPPASSVAQAIVSTRSEG